MAKIPKTFKEKVRLSLFFSIVTILFFSLLLMPRVSAPLIVSYLAYLVVYPAIPALEKIGFNRNLSILTVFLSLIFFTVYPIVKIVPTLTAEAENVQYYIPKVESYVKGRYFSFTDEVKKHTSFEVDDKYIDEAIDYMRVTSTNIILTTPKVLASILEWAFLVPLFLFFFLKDGIAFKHFVLKLIPNSIFERFYYLSHQFNKQLGDYIFAKFVEASIVGFLITLGLMIINVRFALLLGIVAGVTNIIPYAGPVIGFIPGLLLALAEYGGTTTTGAIILLYFVANAVDIAFVFPILVSKIVDLHPIVVVISVILGGQTMGMIGMIISIPVAAALKLIFSEVYDEFY